jgi:hypothetical protein
MSEQAYPVWICLDCGREHGKRAEANRGCTLHEGVCDLCGRKAMVTEPRDFGHLHQSWRNCSQVSDARADDGVVSKPAEVSA